MVTEYSDTLYTLQSLVINKITKLQETQLETPILKSDATKTLKQKATPEQIYIFNLNTEETIGIVNEAVSTKRYQLKKLRYSRVARTVSDHQVVTEYSDTLYTLQRFVINKSTKLQEANSWQHRT